jgi:hypothetical protein
MFLEPPRYLDLTTPGLKIIGDGNSITAGQSHITELGLREPFKSQETVIYNFGVAGQTTQQMIADFDAEVLPFITFDPPTILIALEFGNQIGANSVVQSDAQKAFDLFADYCYRARSAGAYVVACTAHPRIRIAGNVPTYSAQLREANQLLRNGWRAFADAIFDCRTIPEFAKVNRRWCPDDVHPNRYGDILFTDGLMPVLRRIPLRG